MSGNFEKARVVNENEPSTLDEELRELEGATENMREIIFSSFELYDKLLNHLYNAGNIKSHEYFFDDLEQLIYKMRRVQEAAQSINVRILDDETLNIQNPIGSQRLFREEECRKYEMARGSFTLWLKRLNNTLAYFTKILEIIKSAKTSGSKKGLANPKTLIDDTRNILTDFFNRSGIKFEEYQRYDEDRKKQVSQKASAMLDALLFIAPALSGEAREKIRRLHKNYAQVFDSSSYWRRLINLKLGLDQAFFTLNQDIYKDLSEMEGLLRKLGEYFAKIDKLPSRADIVPDSKGAWNIIGILQELESIIDALERSIEYIGPLAFYLQEESGSYDKLKASDLPPTCLADIDQLHDMHLASKEAFENLIVESEEPTERLYGMLKLYLEQNIFRPIERKLLLAFHRLSERLESFLKSLPPSLADTKLAEKKLSDLNRMKEFFASLSQRYLFDDIVDWALFISHSKEIPLDKKERKILDETPIELLEELRERAFLRRNTKINAHYRDLSTKLKDLDTSFGILSLADERFAKKYAEGLIRDLALFSREELLDEISKKMEDVKNRVIIRRVLASPERYIKYLSEDLHEFILGVQELLTDADETTIWMGDSVLPNILRTANTLRDNSA